MKLGEVNLAPVVDDAARRHINETGADVAETHEACRAWWEAFKPTVELWVEQPVFDVRGLVYRRLIDHLRGYPVHEPADNGSTLLSMWVIAAGERWDQIPCHGLAGFGLSFEGLRLIEQEDLGEWA